MKTQTILLKLLRVLAFAGAFSIWSPHFWPADRFIKFWLRSIDSLYEWFHG